MSLRHAGILILAGLLAGGCASAAQLPRDAAILDGAAMPRMLRQCSRDSPPPGEASWRPRPSDILALEASLPKALDPRRYAAGLDWSKAPQGWRRQYVGVVRGGRRFIYGSFFPRSTRAGTEEWRSQPIHVCDGGPVYFGVEFDVEGGTFTQLGFNGPL